MKPVKPIGSTNLFSDDDIAKIRANIFPAAWPRVERWGYLDWHSRSVAKVHASQALAIDVFGTFSESPNIDRVMDSLAVSLGVPAGGPWQIKLEGIDTDNLLAETQPTPVDALAIGANSIIFFEVKFTEIDGGQCTQIKKQKDRLVQCNGNYETQVNPRNGISARCALSGKGMRYWQYVSKVFKLDEAKDYHPCPFAGPWYQWMRNLTICYAMAQTSGKQPAFVVVYADGNGLSVAKKTRHGGWESLKASIDETAIAFKVVSTQDVVAQAIDACPENAIFRALEIWVNNKIETVCNR